MKKYRVSCGSIKKKIVEAKDEFDAFKKALSSHKRGGLGLIGEIVEVGYEKDPDKLSYSSTKRALKELGKWAD